MIQIRGGRWESGDKREMWPKYANFSSVTFHFYLPTLFKTYPKLIVKTKKNTIKIMPRALKGLSQG